MAVSFNKLKKQVRDVIAGTVPGSIQRVPAPTNAAVDASAAFSNEVASVVVTVSHGSSYDTLFRTVPQYTEYGRIVVYLVEPGNVLTYILQTLQGGDVESFREVDAVTKDLLRELRANCEEAGPDAVCFNFECSSTYSESGFGTGMTGCHNDLISWLVKEYGCLCMFSDFSLKALIADWDARSLGPNPFCNVGSFSGQFDLTFDPAVLKASSSAQLNTVGNLCDKGNGVGTAGVHAMGGTILYTVTTAAERAKEYEMEVLTVANMVSNAEFTRNKLNEISTNRSVNVCTAAGARGFAGHVMLKYPASKMSMDRHEREMEKKRKEGLDVEVDDVPARGLILSSCGHWIELMKLDANMERLIQTVQDDYGMNNIRTANLQSAFVGLSGESLVSKMKSEAYGYVQSRPPAKQNRMLKAKKKKFSKQ